MEKEEFYQRVADLLHVEYTFLNISKRRTRWGPREPGNGRFPGHGLVQWFGPDCIKVCLINPALVATFDNPERALAAIAEVCKNLP